MARVTAAEAARTRERLLDAALEVFWQDGLSRPSLTKVAERAGMSRGAVYGHFRNKADVFAALCDRYLMPAAVLEQLQREGAEDPLGTLTSWVSTVLRRARHEREYRMLFELLFLKCEAVEGSEVRERLRTDLDRARRHERALLRAAVERGQLPADLDVELASIAVHALLGGQLRFYALNPELDVQPMLDSLGPMLEALLTGQALRRGAG